MVDGHGCGGEADSELELVQLGGDDIHPDVLHTLGTDLSAALATQGLQVPAGSDLDDASLSLPADGWRITFILPGTAPDHGRVHLAAPHPGEPGAWVLAYLFTDGNGRWRFSAYTEPNWPTPGRAARRRYLRLDWPATPVVLPAGRPVALSARLTNTAAAPWASDDVLSRVVAWILDPSTGNPLPHEHFIGLSGRPMSATLASGESLTMPAIIATLGTEQLPAGSYGLTAVLVGLDLRSSPGTLHLT